MDSNRLKQSIIFIAGLLAIGVIIWFICSQIFDPKNVIDPPPKGATDTVATKEDMKSLIKHFVASVDNRRINDILEYYADSTIKHFDTVEADKISLKKKYEYLWKGTKSYQNTIDSIEQKQGLIHMCIPLCINGRQIQEK